MTVNNSEVLEKLKRRHGVIDDEQDKKLNDAIDDAIAHYLAIASDLSNESKEEVPEKHTFMITNVASKYYVRSGSEGMTSERVDQYQAQYSDDYYAEYMSLLESEYASVEDLGKGKVTFY